MRARCRRTAPRAAGLLSALAAEGTEEASHHDRQEGNGGGGFACPVRDAGCFLPRQRHSCAGQLREMSLTSGTPCGPCLLPAPAGLSARLSLPGDTQSSVGAGAGLCSPLQPWRLSTPPAAPGHRTAEKTHRHVSSRINCKNHVDRKKHECFPKKINSEHRMENDQRNRTWTGKLLLELGNAFWIRNKGRSQSVTGSQTSEIVLNAGQRDKNSHPQPTHSTAPFKCHSRGNTRQRPGHGPAVWSTAGEAGGNWGRGGGAGGGPGDTRAVLKSGWGCVVFAIPQSCRSYVYFVSIPFYQVNI